MDCDSELLLSLVSATTFVASAVRGDVRRRWSAVQVPLTATLTVAQAAIERRWRR